MRRIRSFLAGLTTCWLTASPALATAFAIQGGRGDVESVTQCDPGSYVVGLGGNVGDWIDKIGVVCAPIRHDNTLGPAQQPAIFLGGGGGAPDNAMCNPNELISKLDFGLTETRQVAVIAFFCVNLATNQPGAQKWRAFGNSNSEDKDNRFANTCPQGELVTGFNVRYGRHVNALGAICQPVVLPPAPAPAPKKQVDVLSEDAKDFHGTWTTVSRGVTYELVLRVSGTRVSGVYTAPGRPELGGTITGATKSYSGLVKLNYVWNSDAGASSEGTWKVTTDGRLLGGITVTEPGKRATYYKWEGLRITRDAGEAAVYAKEVAADRDPTGKSIEQCAIAYQRNQARCSQMDFNYRPVCTAETAGIFAACQGLAAQAAAGGAQAGGRQARVDLPVEVFDAANGVGKLTGVLEAEAVVTIVAEVGGGWFEVAGAAVPGGRGFVYSGEGYLSLKED